MLTELPPAGMVKAAPAALAVHAASVNHPTVPAELDRMVKTSPLAPAVAALPALSCSWTLMTPPGPAQAPAVKVRGDVVKARRLGTDAPGTSMTDHPRSAVDEPVSARVTRRLLLALSE